MADISPLSNNEKSTCLRIAGRDEKVKSFIPGRSKVVLMEPVIPDRRQPEGSRHASVGWYDYENNRSIIAVIDLKTDKVLSVRETQVQFQLDAAEQKEAEQLTAKDPRVKEFLKGRSMNPLTRLYFPPAGSGRDPTHRYAIVFLRPTKDERSYAVVDLSTGHVIDILGKEALTSPH